MTAAVSHTTNWSKIVKYALWTVQVLLAALFVFGGAAKLAMPIEEITASVPLPGWFIQFIAVAEIFGAVGLILPSLLRIYPVLTPIAAWCLVVIMIGAVVTTIVTMDVPSATFPFVTGLFLTFVAYGRSRLAPQCSAARLMPLPAAAS
jgi:hypothetical protein